jgi:propanediol utilization protein
MEMGGWHCRNYENCEEFIVAEKSGNAEVGRRLLFNLIFIRISDCFSLFIYIDTIPS